MYCRGEDRREDIVNNYTIKPIAHVKLVNGQVKQSCTGDSLTDTYYCFSYENNDGNDKGSFFCGNHAARDFLRLANLPPLPLFNPLSQAGNNGGGNDGGNNGQPAWDPLAKQLNEAINLLIVCWDVIPYGPLATIQSDLLRFPRSQPFVWKIKKVNHIISCDPQGRTLQDMVSELRTNNNIRQFSFDLLNQELSNINATSYFG